MNANEEKPDLKIEFVVDVFNPDLIEWHLTLRCDNGEEAMQFAEDTENPAIVYKLIVTPSHEMARFLYHKNRAASEY